MPSRFNAGPLVERIRRGAMQGIFAGIGIVEARAVFLIMNPPKTGRLYRRRGVVHQASAPGEAPANDTGRLVNSRSIQLFPDRLAARLNFGTKYAGMLEYGTPKMEPRPFARRSLIETRGEVAAAVAAGIRSQLR